MPGIKGNGSEEREQEHLQLIDLTPYSQRSERLRESADRSGNPRTTRAADNAAGQEQAVMENNTYVLRRLTERSDRRAGYGPR